MNPTQEDIDGIFEKYNTNNTEILLNDRGSVEDKVQLFLSINGFGSTTEIFNFLDSHPLLLPTSMRDLVRHIEQMLEKGILGRQGEEVFLVKTPARAVVMGKRSLNTTGLGFVGEITAIFLWIGQAVRTLSCFSITHPSTYCSVDFL
jgi:hypothetical protein